MMIGQPTRSHPTVQVPPWDHQFEDPAVKIGSPYSVNGGFSGEFNGHAASPGSTGDFSPYMMEALATLQRFLPSNEFAGDSEFVGGDDLDLPFDSFACDNFRMYEFKIRKCARGRSHDWTECPFAHPGEKARRRDPRKYGYSGTSCPEFRKGVCKNGDLCEFSHGVFECWLHPDRYRTQPCKDGTNCRRRICFFAHAPEQLRVPTTQSPRNFAAVDGSPSIRRSLDSYLSNGSYGSSHASYLLSPPGSPPSDSPPMSPNSPSYGTSFNSMSELVANMRNMQVNNNVKVISPPARGGIPGSGFGLNRCSNLRPDFSSTSPTTPTRSVTRAGQGMFDLWETKTCEEEPVMERVESGRDLRAKIYAKLSKENSLGLDSTDGAPDFGWVSELVK